jgi:Ser/Thr protein kinase RdoA (MazF antagonist)
MTVQQPDETLAREIAGKLLHQEIVKSQRLPTGNQNYVYAVSTANQNYVIRLTTARHKAKFLSADYWQDQLLPLGIPLAPFIAKDLEGELSPFPALVMPKLPGDDLGAVYPRLSTTNKKSLARQIVTIHSSLKQLPEAKTYGYISAIESETKHQSWPDFLAADIDVASQRITKFGYFPNSYQQKITHFTNVMRPTLEKVRPQIFMPDTTVKNVLVADATIQGLVDVDEMCAGDPLFVLSLTYAGLEVDGHDTDYADFWAEQLKLDSDSLLRLNYYRLLHIYWFMGEHGLRSENSQILQFDLNLLTTIFEATAQKLKIISN